MQQCTSCQADVACTGTLPAEWGATGHFPALILLTLGLTNLTGSLPASWGGQGAFPALELLGIGLDADDISHLSGTLPPEWGSAAAFQNVTLLGIANCNITGVFSTYIPSMLGSTSVIECHWCLSFGSCVNTLRMDLQ